MAMAIQQRYCVRVLVLAALGLSASQLGLPLGDGAACRQSWGRTFARPQRHVRETQASNPACPLSMIFCPSPAELFVYKFLSEPIYRRNYLCICKNTLYQGKIIYNRNLDLFGIAAPPPPLRVRPA